MIRPVITGTTPDFRPIVSADENAHTAYGCFDGPVRVASVLPAPQVSDAPSYSADAYKQHIHGTVLHGVRLWVLLPGADAAYKMTAAFARALACDLLRAAHQAEAAQGEDSDRASLHGPGAGA